MQDISISFRIAVNTNKERIIELLKMNKDISIIPLEENKLIIGQNNVAKEVRFYACKKSEFKGCCTILFQVFV